MRARAHDPTDPNIKAGLLGWRSLTIYFLYGSLSVSGYVAKENYPTVSYEFLSTVMDLGIALVGTLLIA